MNKECKQLLNTIISRSTTYRNSNKLFITEDKKCFYVFNIVWFSIDNAEEYKTLPIILYELFNDYKVSKGNNIVGELEFIFSLGYYDLNLVYEAPSGISYMDSNIRNMSKVSDEFIAYIKEKVKNPINKSSLRYLLNPIHRRGDE